MLSTGAQLLRAIVADPDDTDARLVYADYLDESREALAARRAEFIRLDVEALRSSATKQHKSRLRELRALFRKELLRTLQLSRGKKAFPGGLGLTWRAGFVEEVRWCREDDWIADGPLIAAICPLRFVRLNGKVPYQWTNDDWRWLPSTDLPKSSSRWKASIIAPLWDDSFLANSKYPNLYEGFATAYDAYEALSERCLTWARSAGKVGYPVVPVQAGRLNVEAILKVVSEQSR